MDTFKPTRKQREKHPDLTRRWKALTRITNSLYNEIRELDILGLSRSEAQEMLGMMIKWKNNIYLEMKK